MMRYIFFLLLFLPNFINALDKHLLFNNYMIENGLPSSSVLEVVQDSSGFIWIATESGLAKYDGVVFTTYYNQHDNEGSLPSNVINKLYIDTKGQLWIGTNYGLARYDNRLDRFMRYIPYPQLPQDDPFNVVKGIDEDSKGTIYALFEKGQLFMVNKTALELKLNIQKESSKYLIIDDDDQCWIAVSDMFYKYGINSNLTTQIKIEYPYFTNDREVRDVIITDSLFYIASYKSDLLIYNYINNEFKSIKLLENIPHTNSLFKSGDDLLIGTSEGLKVYNTRTKKVITYQENNKDMKSISSNAINDVFIDRQGNLWLSTRNGLNVAYARKGFQGYSYNYNNFPTNNSINAITKDKNGHLWFGYSEGGISIFKDEENALNSFDHIPGILPSEQLYEVFCITKDSENNMWIGTYINGLLKYGSKNKQFTQYYPETGITSIDGSDVRWAIEDNKGNIWIAIHGKGIMVLRKGGGKFENMQDFDPSIPLELNQPWCFQINFDRDSNLWLATNNGCYYYNFESKHYKHYNHSIKSRYKLSDNYISSIFFDSKNNVWMTSRSGLNIIYKDTLIILDKSNGMPNNFIQAVTEDVKGAIWASTLNGIAKIEALDNFSFNITHFNAGQGLHSNSFQARSLFNTPDGYLYFGGKSGFTTFKPTEISIDLQEPPVIFTNLYLFNEKVNICAQQHSKKKINYCLDENIQFLKELTIKEHFNMIGIEFAALSFIHPDKNQYKYKLEGFDSEWINIYNRNIAYYTNLKPGSYTFKVLASNSDGVWASEPTALKIKILPPIWKTKVAFIIYLLLIIGIVIYLNKLAVEKEKILLQFDQQEKLKELRTRFFMNVSHELKTPLTLITVPLKRIIENYHLHKTSPAIQDIDMINRNVNRLMRIMNQIFDFRKIELNKMNMQVVNANLVTFTEAILEYFDYQVQLKNIQLKTKFPDHAFAYFDADKMDKIMFNLLSNAIKHTAYGGTISLELNPAQEISNKNNHANYYEWSITDSGPGIPENKLEEIFSRFSYTRSNNSGGTGIGLSIVKEFIELHKGKIIIESNTDTTNGKQSYTKAILHIPEGTGFYANNQINENENVAEQIMLQNKQANILSKLEQKQLEMDDEFNMEKDNAYTALVIDDDNDVCEILKRELSVLYKVIIANDGLSGLMKAQKHVPDVIISDVMMPGMDGYELCKILKSKLETSHIPVILLTAKSAEEDEIEAFSTGADAYVAKPFNLQKLISQAESLINNRNKLKNMFLKTYGIELKKVVPTKTDEKFITSLLQVINANLSDKDLNVDKITREIGISRAQLYKKVNSVANTSVNLFIRTVRLKKAAELLAEGTKTVTEVAYAVGFDNLPYFSKCFQEEYGESPSKFAAGHKI